VPAGNLALRRHDRRRAAGRSSPRGGGALLVPPRDPRHPRPRPDRGSAAAHDAERRPRLVRRGGRARRACPLRERTLPAAVLPVGPARPVRLVLRRRRAGEPCFATLRPVRSNALAVGLVVVAVICFVLAVLYGLGVLQIAVSDTGSPHHYTHMILFIVLGVASLIGANFTRQKTV